MLSRGWKVFVGAYVLGCVWVIYRTAAGHPILGGIQW